MNNLEISELDRWLENNDESYNEENALDNCMPSELIEEEVWG